MTDERKRRGDPEEKSLKSAPENKVRGRSAKEGEEPVEYGPDGCFHEMEADMKAAALDRDVGPENAPPEKPPVIHVMELQMKGEAVSDYIEENPHIDQGLPVPEEPPLPGKPPVPPLGGEGRARTGVDDRQAKPTQYPTEPDRRGRR